MNQYSFSQRFIFWLLGLSLLSCSWATITTDIQATKIAADVFATQTAMATEDISSIATVIPTETKPNETTSTKTLPTKTSTPLLSTTKSATSTPPQNNVTASAISTVDDLYQVVVRLEVEGDSVEPDGYRVLQAGSGSAFIIDPSGLAVTNNHVVAGADSIKVWWEGAEDALTAEVLGLSECDDLAVIKIEGDNYPYLEWQPEFTFLTSFLEPDLRVYAAGFPWGEADLRVTKGNLLDYRMWVPTRWAFTEQVLVHDALLRSGNSGGPLVTEQAQIVGINYAENSETEQSFAIAVDQARDIVADLQQGIPYGLGINGLVINEGPYKGVWVRAVQADSLADQAGIRAGDIITHLAGTRLGLDGSLARYCQTIQQFSATDTIDVELIRSSTNERLAGQINGSALTPLASSETILPPVATTAMQLDISSGFNFIEDFSSNHLGWDVGRESSASAEVTKEITPEETYRISTQFKQGTAIWSAIPHISATNFRLDFDATIRLASAENTFGLIVIPRYQDDFNFYAIQFAQSGAVLVDHHQAGKWQMVKYDRFWEARLKPRQTYHFTITFQDTNLSLALDDHELLTVDNLTLTAPGNLFIGVTSPAGEEQLVVDFDNITIVKPEYSVK